MALASASKLKVEKLPQMTATSVYDSWVNSSCLLPLLDALQDHQVSLIRLLSNYCFHPASWKM